MEWRIYNRMCSNGGVIQRCNLCNLQQHELQYKISAAIHNGGSMERQGFIHALINVTVISLVIVFAIIGVIHQFDATAIGPTIILLGFVPLIALRLFGRSITSCGADIVFGAIDTGILGIAALIGASFAGVLGAIVGGAVGDSITDGFAGLFEGKIAQYLRRLGIDEARTPLSSSMGKMSGCLLGVGIVLTAAWSILGMSP